MELDGPAEALFVDHEDEQEGEGEAEGETKQEGEQAEEGGFGEHHIAKLGGGSAEVAEEAELAASIEDESEQGPAGRAEIRHS